MRGYGAGTSLLSGDRVAHLYLVEYETASGQIRYNDSGWDIEWFGFTWYAGHGVIGLSIADESVNLEMHGASIQIAALNPAIVSQALSQNNRGRYCAIHHAILDPDTYELVSVTREWSGRLSNVRLSKPQTDGNAVSL